MGEMQHAIAANLLTLDDLLRGTGPDRRRPTPRADLAGRDLRIRQHGHGIAGCSGRGHRLRTRPRLESRQGNFAVGSNRMNLFDPQVIAFTIVAAFMTMLPGADTLLVVRNSLRGGRRDGFLTVAGICSGLFVHALLSALGLSVVLAHSAAAFTAMKIAGPATLPGSASSRFDRACAGPRPRCRIRHPRACPPSAASAKAC